MPAVSPAGLVGLAEPAAAVAAERPAGLSAPQYGSPPLPSTATVCFPIAEARRRRTFIKCEPKKNQWSL